MVFGKIQFNKNIKKNISSSRQSGGLPSLVLETVCVVQVGMSPGAVLEVHSQPRVEVATLRTTCLLTEIEAALSKFHRC